MSAHIKNSCGCVGLKCGHPVCGWKQEEEPCWQPFMKSTSIVKESACIMWNICTTHNGDYAPFRQRHFDLFPWNITPAAQPGLPLFLLKWRTLQCEAAGIPPWVYMIALLQLLVCVQLDGPGVEALEGGIIWSWHYLRVWNSPTLHDDINTCPTNTGISNEASQLT